jgi:glutamate transport system substrate-binding protein
MLIRQIGAVTAASVLALGLTACGDSAKDGGATGGGGGGEKFKVGIKFDLPGLGLKEGSKYTGLDVDVATYVAKELGHEAGDIQWVQAPSAQRETLISTGQVDMVVATYSITGPEALTGKKLCSVTGSTSAQKVKDKYPGVQLQEFGTYSECVAALVSKGVDALTTDNTILAGYASQAQYKGKLKVVGAPFSEERYGIGIKKGDTATCEKINTAIAKMISSGDWQKAIDANLGPAGFKVDSATNPPKQDACS